MLVQVIKDYVPHVGRRGERKDINRQFGEILVKAGAVTEVETPPPDERPRSDNDTNAPTPAIEPTPKPTKKRRSGRRVYKRRDIVAEPPTGERDE